MPNDRLYHRMMSCFLQDVEVHWYVQCIQTRAHICEPSLYNMGTVLQGNNLTHNIPTHTAQLESLKKTKAALQKPRGGKRKASLHTAASAATVEGQDPQDEDHDTGAPSPKEQPNAVSEAHLQVDDSLSS
eukprot:m.226116 g.226116  ORF g.226116 m.226116 type:complete len:130 (+) comp15164_c0_seq3:559-948(+)